ncbi:endonuclease MutS2 [Anoxynatronum sibiricum]|uniref:Endonuclease MutS2 n=1 Tax=Anoxynatronum sibiricum TaxID=210623 RepID=A0ABU9VV24_9CLOT
MNQRTLRVLEYDKIIDMLGLECQSPLGQLLAESTTPETELLQIQELQQETSEAESLIMQKGPIPLSGLQDISILLRRADIGAALDPGQLLVVARQLSLARKCRSHMQSIDQREKLPRIDSLVSQVQSVKALEARITTCIISDSEVSDQASLLLRQIRKQIQQKNEAVKSKLNQMIQSVKTQKYLQDPIVTIRQGRYVIPVRHEYRNMVPGLVHDQSSSGATLFIEPMAIVELNNQLKELKLKEELEVERILMELTDEVAMYALALSDNQQKLQYLDYWMAKGLLSVKMKAVEPSVVENQVIHLRNARHPLIDLKQVVPNNISIGEKYNALVITGPNTGGKTVALKTAGLFILMAQSGLHLPADYGTTVGVFQEVFADIGDEQSIEQSLSTFSSHMTNIVEILQHFTGRSLVLLDELGAGTDPDEGAALAMAILDHLIRASATVVATTHYSELKQYALTNERVENACVEFDIATLSPTYRLLIGVPGKSNAFEISKKLGINEHIVENARKLLTTENVAFEDVLQTIETNRIQIEKELKMTSEARFEAETILGQVKAQKMKLEDQRETILAGARREAQQLLKKTKTEIDQTILELRKAQDAAHQQSLGRETEKIRNRIREQLDEVQGGESELLLSNESDDKSQSREKSFKKGDEVRIPSLNQTGSIISIDSNNENASVLMGMMKMTLPISGLIKENRKQQHIQKGVQRIIKNKAETSKADIDIRGTDLEEALYLADKFLDDAYLSGREQVTIIHGVGTGVLKRGIQTMLSGHRLVSQYRDGQYGEGGAGVTIATFKKN